MTGVVDSDVGRAISAVRGDLDAPPIHLSHRCALVDTGDYLVETCEVCGHTDIGALFRRCPGVPA